MLNEFKNYDCSDLESEMLTLYARVRQEGMTKVQSFIHLFQMGYKPTRYVLHCVKTKDKHIFFK